MFLHVPVPVCVCLCVCVCVCVAEAVQHSSLLQALGVKISQSQKDLRLAPSPVTQHL